MPMPQFCSKDEAVAAVREAAWDEEVEPDWQPAAIVEGEQLYRNAAPKPRKMIHCYSGFGMDVSLESAEDAIARATEIYWIDHLLHHDLAVILSDPFEGYSRAYDVKAPWKRQPQNQEARA